MKLNILKKLSFVVGITSLLLFTGCGGQSSCCQNSEINTTVAVAVCDNANISEWSTIVKGDVVFGDEGSELQFDHDSANTKKVCAKVADTAYIIKQGG